MHAKLNVAWRLGAIDLSYLPPRHFVNRKWGMEAQGERKQLRRRLRVLVTDQEVSKQDRREGRTGCYFEDLATEPSPQFVDLWFTQTTRNNLTGRGLLENRLLA
jgi:hypothetical protein